MFVARPTLFNLQRLLFSTSSNSSSSQHSSQEDSEAAVAGASANSSGTGVIYPINPQGDIKPEFSLVIADSTVMRIKFLQLKDVEKYAVL